MAQSDSQPNSVNVVVKCEMNYNATPGPLDQNNVYEQMVPENRRIKPIPNSEYAELKLDDYVDIESSMWKGCNQYGKNNYYVFRVGHTTVATSVLWFGDTIIFGGHDRPQKFFYI